MARVTLRLFPLADFSYTKTKIYVYKTCNKAIKISELTRHEPFVTQPNNM